MTTPSHHYYAFDVAQLLISGIADLQDVINLDTHGSHSILYELKETLLKTETLLQEYFVKILQEDHTEITNEILSKIQSGPAQTVTLPSLSDCMDALRKNMEQRQMKDPSNKSNFHGQQHHSRSPAKQIRTSMSSGNLHSGYSPCAVSLIHCFSD